MKKLLFNELLTWRDPVARSGPENMAVDELLLELLGDLPVLRIYGWSGDWVSLGYFQALGEVGVLFGDGVEVVRRMTGGGIVDHREDLTYSLLVPRGLPLAEARGEESYRAIHAAVVVALTSVGVQARMLTEDDAKESHACFEKGVVWDVVGEEGRKLAGAGQKRTRVGLLHQGSVLVGKQSRGPLREVLPNVFASKVVPWSPEPPLLARAKEFASTKYATPSWTARR